MVSVYAFMNLPRSSIYEHTFHVLATAFYFFISISYAFRTAIYLGFVFVSIPIYVNSIVENPRLFFKENGISEVSKQEFLRS